MKYKTVSDLGGNRNVVLCNYEAAGYRSDSARSKKRDSPVCMEN
jgi:hypothetical protein